MVCVRIVCTSGGEHKPANITAGAPHCKKQNSNWKARSWLWEKSFPCCLADADITNHIMTIWMCQGTPILWLFYSGKSSLSIGWNGFSHHFPTIPMSYSWFYRYSWWLTYPPEKYEFVRLDHHPNFWGSHKIAWCQTTNPYIYIHTIIPYIYIPSGKITLLWKFTRHIRYPLCHYIVIFQSPRVPVNHQYCVYNIYNVCIDIYIHYYRIYTLL